MKLIYGGKELNDDQTVESANIQSNIAVILVAKKKQHVTQPKKKEEETTTAPQTTPSTETTQPPATTTPSTTETSTTTTATTTPSTTTPTTTATQEEIPGGPGSPEYEQTVQQFLEMGYDKNDIDECMKAAFYDRATAAEFLISGIPDNVKQMMQENGGNLPTPPTGGVGGLAAQLAGNQQGFSLRELFTLSPQLNSLRTAIRQNPVLLREFLQHVSQVSPELYQIIQSNPREFLEIINEPSTGATPTGTAPTTGTPQTPTGGETGEVPPGQQPPPGAIYITRDDERKINELVGLGFTKNEALQAYLACDKNQEMAANLLFENRDRFGFDEEGGEEDDQHDMHDDQ